MFKKLIVALAAIAPGVVLNAAETPAATVECVPKAGNAGCSIQWDFLQQPRAYFQVEYLDDSSMQWRAFGRPYDSVRTSSEPVPAARLYRVRGCDDATVRRNCVTSTVQWAIARPTPEEIPDYLVDGNGVEMQIAKNAPETVQIAQYNVYRLVQLLDRIQDLSKLPPMTQPGTGAHSVSGASEDEQILAGIYENYTERRRLAIRAQKPDEGPGTR